MDEYIKKVDDGYIVGSKHFTFEELRRIQNMKTVIQDFFSANEENAEDDVTDEFRLGWNSCIDYIIESLKLQKL